MASSQDLILAEKVMVIGTPMGDTNSLSSVGLPRSSAS